MRESAAVRLDGRGAVFFRFFFFFFFFFSVPCVFDTKGHSCTGAATLHGGWARRTRMRAP
jgi:hypothetical protein